MSGVAVVAVPVLKTAVRVRIPTIGLPGAVQIVAAVYDGPCGFRLILGARLLDRKGSSKYKFTGKFGNFENPPRKIFT